MIEPLNISGPVTRDSKRAYFAFEVNATIRTAETKTVVWCEGCILTCNYLHAVQGPHYSVCPVCGH